MINLKKISLIRRNTKVKNYFDNSLDPFLFSAAKPLPYFFNCLEYVLSRCIKLHAEHINLIRITWIVAAILMFALFENSHSQTVVSSTTIYPENTTIVDVPNRIVETPPLLQANRFLEMMEIIAFRNPSGFVLVSENNTRFGPYTLKEGATIGSAQAPLLITRLSENDFFLTDPRDNNIFGPFGVTNGSSVNVRSVTLTLERQPSSLNIQIRHPGNIGTPPIVAVAEWNPAIQTSLYELRDSLVTVANNLAIETAPVTYESVPTIISPWGTRFSPTVKKSLRDRETARHAADRSAAHLLETFMRKKMRTPLSRRPDGSFIIDPAINTQYIVGAIWQVKDPDAITAAASYNAVWWTLISIGPQTAANLNFNKENAGDWRSVFCIPPLRD